MPIHVVSAGQQGDKNQPQFSDTVPKHSTALVKQQIVATKRSKTFKKRKKNKRTEAEGNKNEIVERTLFGGVRTVG